MHSRSSLALLKHMHLKSNLCVFICSIAYGSIHAGTEISTQYDVINTKQILYAKAGVVRTVPKKFDNLSIIIIKA